jgi:hypothetical protein
MALLLPAIVGLGTAWLVHFNVRDVISYPAADPPGVPAA